MPCSSHGDVRLKASPNGRCGDCLPLRTSKSEARRRCKKGAIRSMCVAFNRRSCPVPIGTDLPFSGPEAEFPPSSDTRVQASTRLKHAVETRR